MQANQSIRISLPSELAEEFERVRRTEKRTPADLVREAVRSYLSFLRNFPEVAATRAELKAVREGRRAVARGEYIELDELIEKMGPARNQSRSKKPKQVSRER